MTSWEKQKTESNTHIYSPILSSSGRSVCRAVSCSVCLCVFLLSFNVSRYVLGVVFSLTLALSLSFSLSLSLPLSASLCVSLPLSASLSLSFSVCLHLYISAALWPCGSMYLSISGAVYIWWMSARLLSHLCALSFSLSLYFSLALSLSFFHAHYLRLFLLSFFSLGRSFVRPALFLTQAS